MSGIRKFLASTEGLSQHTLRIDVAFAGLELRTVPGNGRKGLRSCLDKGRMTETIGGRR